MSASPVYETESFVLYAAPSEYEGPCQGQLCYRLVNKDTGVCEGEGITLSEAILACHRAQRRLTQVLVDPAAIIEQEEALASQQAAWQQMLAGGPAPDDIIN